MREIDPLDLVDTIREGLLVLEPDLTVSFANRAFCSTFSVSQKETIGRKLYELGNGQWDIPALRSLMETVLPQRKTIESFEVDWEFPSIGQRVMLLNARTVHRSGTGAKRILLAIEDVTERVRLERERAVAHERVATLLEELRHRIKNNLQIIASIVGMEARNQKGDEGKAALERVSRRVAAVAQLYTVLAKAETGDAIDAAIYLEELSNNLGLSLEQSNGKPIHLETDIQSVKLPIQRAIPLGLIVNELVTNAVKYAFRDKSGGTVWVTLNHVPGYLRLTVADDGKGIDPRADSGLGARLVEAFSHQLGGVVERESGNQGTRVSLTLPWHEDR